MSSVNKSGSELTPDHIVVVKKDDVREYDANGNPAVFADKGTPFFNEADFNSGSDAYQSTKQKIADLEQKLQHAESAVSIAENLRTLKEKKEYADSLLRLLQVLCCAMTTTIPISSNIDSI